MEKSLTWAAKLAGLAMILAVAAVAGCGGGDEAAAPEESAPLSEEEYTTEVQGVLQPLSEDLQRIGTESATETTPEDIAGSLGEVEAALQTGIDELSAITPPEEAAAAHDQLIAAFEGFKEGTTTAREAAEEGNLQALATDYQQSALQFQQDVLAVNKEFQKAGIDVAGALGAPPEQ